MVNRFGKVILACLVLLVPANSASPQSSDPKANELFVEAVTLFRGAQAFAETERQEAYTKVRALFDQILRDHSDSRPAKVIEQGGSPGGVVLADLPVSRPIGWNDGKRNIVRDLLDAYGGDRNRLSAVASSYEWAILACAAYSEDGSVCRDDITGRADVRTSEIGWSPGDPTIGDYLGVGQAVAFVYTHQDGRAALVFRGSDEAEDFVTNVLGTADPSFLNAAQLRFAVKIAEDVVASHPNTTFVGHSLGGRLAQIGTLSTGRPAVAFNSAPLGSWETVRFAHTFERRDRLVTRLRGPDDPVSVLAAQKASDQIEVSNMARTGGGRVENLIGAGVQGYTHSMSPLAGAMQIVHQAESLGWVAAYLDEQKAPDNKEVTPTVGSRNYTAPNGYMWAQLASRPTIEEARDFAVGIGNEARIFRTQNGWHAITGALLYESESLSDMISDRGWPSDSLLTRGESFVEELSLDSAGVVPQPAFIHTKTLRATDVTWFVWDDGVRTVYDTRPLKKGKDVVVWGSPDEEGYCRGGGGEGAVLKCADLVAFATGFDSGGEGGVVSGNIEFVFPKSRLDRIARLSDEGELRSTGFNVDISDKLSVNCTHWITQGAGAASEYGITTWEALVPKLQCNLWTDNGDGSSGLVRGVEVSASYSQGTGALTMVLSDPEKFYSERTEQNGTCNFSTQNQVFEHKDDWVAECPSKSRKETTEDSTASTGVVSETVPLSFPSASISRSDLCKDVGNQLTNAGLRKVFSVSRSMSGRSLYEGKFYDFTMTTEPVQRDGRWVPTTSHSGSRNFDQSYKIENDEFCLRGENGKITCNRLAICRDAGALLVAGDLKSGIWTLNTASPKFDKGELENHSEVGLTGVTQDQLPSDKVADPAPKQAPAPICTAEWITTKNGCKACVERPEGWLRYMQKTANPSTRWSGACTDGLIEGQGVLTWFSGEDEGWRTILNARYPAVAGVPTFELRPGDVTVRYATNLSDGKVGYDKECIAIKDVVHDVSPLLVIVNANIPLANPEVQRLVMKEAERIAIADCEKERRRVNIRKEVSRFQVYSINLALSDHPRVKPFHDAGRPVPGGDLYRILPGCGFRPRISGISECFQENPATNDIRQQVTATNQARAQAIRQAERQRAERAAQAEKARKQAKVSAIQEQVEQRWAAHMDDMFSGQFVIKNVGDLLQYNKARAISLLSRGVTLQLATQNMSFQDGTVIIAHEHDPTDVLKPVRDAARAEMGTWEQWFDTTSNVGRDYSGPSINVLCRLDASALEQLDGKVTARFAATMQSLNGRSAVFNCEIKQ